MSQMQDVLQHCLRDHRITKDEVAVIRQQVDADGRLDLDDVKFLVKLLVDAKEVCTEFDELFFRVLKQVVLHDGRIGQDEQFYLLKMLYSDGRVRDSERDFLVQLRNDAIESTPEFDALCETALATADVNWDLGGK